MGCVQQAVLEFDEEIRAPWRPRLVSVPDAGHPASSRPPLAHPSRRSPSRVGVCRPPTSPARPAGATRRTTAGPGVRAEVPGGSSADGRLPHRRPASRGVAAAPLRLTPRARRLAVVLAMAGAVALGSWLGPWVNGSGSDLRLAGESSVVVRSGDTLWSIASSMAEGADVRPVVDRIQELNGLQGTEIRPGQTLLLP
jgi:nucleoid-associated protein YgaU